MKKNVKEGYTLEKVLREGKAYLKKLNIDEFEVDAWELLSFTLGINRSTYFLNCNEEIGTEDYIRYNSYIEKRGNRIPLQYITGIQEFMGFTFHVTEDVLIPRFDTEILVDEVIKVSNNKDVLDVCTGSGCIIISLSKLGNILSGTGLDISKKALEVAKENKRQLEANISLIESDLFENINQKYDIIVSNPPYIPTKDIEVLMDEVRIHEPFLALDGKDDGLYFYNKIIKEAPSFIKDGGYIFFEIGYNQGVEVSRLLQESGFSDIQVIKDLARHDRVVKARYTNYLEHFT